MAMRWSWVVVLVLAGPAWGGETAYDWITLRDGTVLLGLANPTGSRGSVELVVRRAWLRGAAPKWADRAEHELAHASRRALADQRRRLTAWRRERSAALANPAPDDKILTWIDSELKRLDQPDAAASSPLVVLKLGRAEFRSLKRQPAATRRLSALAWITELREPEKLSTDQLRGALESRGLVVDDGKTQLPALDRLLPPQVMSETVWLTRRAATELAVDPGRRLVRYQNFVYPEDLDPVAAPIAGLTNALAQIRQLLDQNAPPPQDPLVKEFRRIEAAGGAGAVVSQLEISPQLDSATAESVLWVRQAHENWIPVGHRVSTVRAADVAPGASQALGGDPQIQAAFQLLDSLGLGGATAELKQKSLTLGAAVQKALANVRSAAAEDLSQFAFPVLEPGR